MIPNTHHFANADKTVPINIDWVKDVLGIGNFWLDPQLWYENDFPIKIYFPESLWSTDTVAIFMQNIDSINTKSEFQWFTKGTNTDYKAKIISGGGLTVNYRTNQHIDSINVEVGFAQFPSNTFIHEIFGHGLGLDPLHITPKYNNGNNTNFAGGSIDPRFAFPTYQDIANITMGRLLQNAKDNGKRTILLMNYFQNE